MNDRFRFRVWDNGFKKYRTGLGINNGLVCTYDDNTCVLEQCTGLKDRNQKLIYEGDILDFDLSTPRNGGHYRGFIRWQKQNELIGWMISDMDMSGDWDLRQIAHPNDWMVWGEIIGNIHENEDLLEVGGK